jgi:hypothetical protein
MEPLVFSVPFQPADAVQEVEFVEVQFKVNGAPGAAVAKLAVSDTVGAGGGAVTVTVAVALALPPDPVQVNVKLVFAVSGAVDTLPLVASDPLHPWEAVQEVALVELQVSFAVAPDCTVVGAAVNVTVGACGVVAPDPPEPPPPEQAASHDDAPRMANRTFGAVIQSSRERGLIDVFPGVYGPNRRTRTSTWNWNSIHECMSGPAGVKASSRITVNTYRSERRYVDTQTWADLGV